MGKMMRKYGMEKCTKGHFLRKIVPSSLGRFGRTWTGVEVGSLKAMNAFDDDSKITKV